MLQYILCQIFCLLNIKCFQLDDSVLFFKHLHVPKVRRYRDVCMFVYHYTKQPPPPPPPSFFHCTSVDFGYNEFWL